MKCKDAKRMLRQSAGVVRSSAWLSIAGGHDGGGLNHQNNCPIRSARAVNDTPWNYEALPRLQIDRLPFEIDDKVPVQDKEKLVVVFMLVPMVLALHDTQANDRVVHFAERLIVPRVRA